MHYIFDEAENKTLKFWKYRYQLFSPWMADISVSALKKPYRSISRLNHNPIGIVASFQ